MPLNWTIDHDLRLVTARAEGTISAEDVKTYLGSVAAEGGMPYAKLFDISEADGALTVADLQALGRSIRQYAVDGYGPLGPLAIVVGQGQSHFQAAFFADASPINRPLRIFRDQRQARSGWSGCGGPEHPQLLRHIAPITARPCCATLRSHQL